MCRANITLDSITVRRNKKMKLEEIKEELQQLCTDYLDILQHLKNQKIISEETFNICSLNKNSFLEK